MIDNHKIKSEQDPGHTQFVCSVYNDKYGEIISYNDIINHIANQQDEDTVKKSKCTISHEGKIIDSITKLKVS